MTQKAKAQLWETLKSQVLYEVAPWIRLSKHQVRLPDGTVVDDYHRIEMPQFAVVFAQAADGRVIVERQYKHGVGRVVLTLPTGAVEDGEEPLNAAQRELLEETGYASGQWRSLGSYVMNGNYGCGKAHLFAARNARRVASPRSGDLEDMEILVMDVEEVANAVSDGSVGTLSTATAIALATNPRFSCKVRQKLQE